jgi:hypothetical protein
LGFCLEDSVTDQFDLNAYLKSFRDEDGMGFPEGESGYRSSFPLAKRIVCEDGFSLSAQASHGAYCSPREDIGPWWAVEVGYPSAAPELIMEYAEQPEKPTDTVYAYVPVELVEQLIALHGGPNAETRARIKR